MVNHSYDNTDYFTNPRTFQIGEEITWYDSEQGSYRQSVIRDVSLCESAGLYPNPIEKYHLENGCFFYQDQNDMIYEPIRRK